MKRRLAVILVVLGASAGVAGAAVLPGITTPTRNISCLYVPGPPASLLCKLAHSGYAQALQRRCMAGAAVDWHGFQLQASRRATILCSGGILYNPGTQHPRYRALAYGKVWRQGGFTCSSRITGLTCRNGANHGLFLSRQSWRAW